MSFYEKELRALKRAGRYRSRTLCNESLHDFSSNDYLGLAHKKSLHTQSCQDLQQLSLHGPKASMLVNGYHLIHKEFEDALKQANGFEDAVIFGSGFNANIALIEALVRKGDRLFMDELYHASGVLATQLNGIDVVFFKHNDMQQLRELVKNSNAKRNIIAVEGIYSMDGDLCSPEVFNIADEFEALLIVDEAHSSGVVGKSLMGVFDLYNIAIKENHIKMGTLGKAYGSFGAYVLASEHIVDYLLNRAKPLIYATALSLYDTRLAHKSLEYILSHTQELQTAIKRRQEIVQEELNLYVDGLIVPIIVGDNNKVIAIKEQLLAEGFMIGAIRQPTVSKAIIRLIARIGEPQESLRELCRRLVTLL